MKRSLLFSVLASLSLLLASNAFADHKAHPHHQYHHKHKHAHYQPSRAVTARHVTPAYVASHSRAYPRAHYARVVDARPIYRSVAVSVPVESCQVETHAYNTRSGRDSIKGTVVGGLIGAAIGHELGNGRGHATAAGGLLGAAIGNDLAADRSRTHYENREVCRTSYRTEYQQELLAYDVSYNYGGRIHHTETRHHPGTRIAVDVTIAAR